MDGWKKTKPDRCMDESIETQNEEHGDGQLWLGIDVEMDGTKKPTERSKWMDEWLDRQKDKQFNRYMNRRVDRQMARKVALQIDGDRKTQRERETERQKHSTTFQSITGFALPSLIHNYNYDYTPLH